MESTQKARLDTWRENARECGPGTRAARTSDRIPARALKIAGMWQGFSEDQLVTTGVHRLGGTGVDSIDLPLAVGGKTEMKRKVKSKSQKHVVGCLSSQKLGELKCM